MPGVTRAPARAAVSGVKAKRFLAVPSEHGFQRLGEHRLRVLGVVTFPARAEDGSTNIDRMRLLDRPQ